GAVYAEADRLGLTRGAGALAAALARVAGASQEELLTAGLVHNDLQDAARSLCPGVDDALDALRATGAGHALVSGSGPTCVGLFSDLEEARDAARQLAARRPAPILTATVPAGSGAVRPAP
nr:4-(cytidine 5'-diphospho)-2-C-methyl-D-erythritol kinase [Solirubrobacterales bacterium]